MSLFRHRCWFCGHSSREVVFLTADAGYHQRLGETPWQCSDAAACNARYHEANSALAEYEPTPHSQCPFCGEQIVGDFHTCQSEVPSWVGSTPIIEPWTFGQGSFGKRCRLCCADDYSGTLMHRVGCPGEGAPE